MGEVYAGYDARLDRSVALKRFWSGKHEPSQVRKRFRREARSIARLHHPAIVQVYDWVETEDCDWIVMELVAGSSLRRVLSAGALEPLRVAKLTSDLLAGLAAAHAAGIVHRDLKPENVMITPGTGHPDSSRPDGGRPDGGRPDGGRPDVGRPDGGRSDVGRSDAARLGEQAKILDFGLAKNLGLEAIETQISRDDALLGTLTAMSPEQVQGDEVGPHSDLFSLGSLVYEMATGKGAFKGETRLDTMQRICTWHPPPAHAINPAVPETLAAFIGRLLEKDPRYRPASAEQALLDLDDLVAELKPARTVPANDGSGDAQQLDDETLNSSTLWRGLPRDAPGGAAPKAAAPATAAAPEPERVETAQPAASAAPGSRRWGVLALVLAGVVLLAFGAWRLLRAPAPLYVVVPEVVAVSESPEARQQDLVASAVRSGLHEGLLELHSVSPLSAPEAGLEDPVVLARAAGADEVMAARLDCGAFLCQLELQRRDGDDGRLLWSRALAIDPGELLEVSRAVIAHLPQAYPKRPARPGAARLEVQPEDYRDYLRLNRQFRQRHAGLSVEALLVELERLQRTSPRYPQLSLFEMRVLLTAFQESRDPALLSRAESALDRAGAVAPEGDPRVLIQQAHLARIAGDSEAAEQALATLERLHPGNVRADYQRARWLEKGGHTAAALALMERVLERLPSYGYFIDYSGMLSRSGDIAGARRALEAALERLPNHYEALSRLAQLELMSGSPQRAAELYEALVERSPESAELTNLGTALMLARRYDEAAERFRQALDQAPGSPFTLLNLADAELLAGRGTAAAAFYEQVLERAAADPDPQKLLTVRAQALAHLERVPQAVAAAQEALRLAPDNPMTAYEAALVFALVGDTASAQWNAQRALQLGVHQRWFSFPWFDPIRAGLEALE